MIKLTSCCAIAALFENATVTSTELSWPAANFPNNSPTVKSSVILNSRFVRIPELRGISNSRSLLGLVSSGHFSAEVIDSGRSQAGGILRLHSSCFWVTMAFQLAAVAAGVGLVVVVIVNSPVVVCDIFVQELSLSVQ